MHPAIRDDSRWNGLSKVWKSYGNALNTHPLRTRALSAGGKQFINKLPHLLSVVLGVGDAIAQKIELLIAKRNAEQYQTDRASQLHFNPYRTIRMSILGTFVIGPNTHYWFLVRY